MKRLSWRHGLALLLLPLAFATQACNTYSYLDVDLTVGTGFETSTTTGLITNCHVFVTGAAKDDFALEVADCRADPGTKEIKKLQYSTFADSGTLTFQLRLFEKGFQSDGCEIGNGMQSVTIDPGKTSALTVVKADYHPPGTCP
jgi:hypothetical protein